MSYRERLDIGLVTSWEWLKRQCKEDVALSNDLNLNTTSSYTHLSHHLHSATAVPSLMPPTMTSPQANNAYNLPSVSVLIQIHCASTSNPVPSTWFAAINAETYATFPGLTLRNLMKHCPSSEATVKGHLK